MHHHLSDNKNIKNATIDIAKEYNLPIRNMFDCDLSKPDILYKDFTIKNVSINALKNMISEHHDENITIELMTHPGYIDEYTKSITSYVDRDKELEILKEAKENKIFNKIDLINFKQLYIK